jgi:hypothetical protein
MRTLDMSTIEPKQHSKYECRLSLPAYSVDFAVMIQRRSFGMSID